MRYSRKSGLLFALLTIMVLVSACSVSPGSGGDKVEGTAVGFLALSGDEAAGYVLPSDMQLVLSNDLSRYDLTYERYQQYYGGMKALVLGAQITLYREDSGTILTVIGAHYSDMTPTSSVILSEDAANGIVDLDINPGGKRKIELMINPTTGRYFYRVESQRFDSRWFHWIDAQTGMVINKYDGIATSHGIGVKGDTKDMSQLTLFNGNEFELVSNDGRQQTYDAQNRPFIPLLGQLFPNIFLPGTLGADADDHWTEPGTASPGQAALVDAQYYSNVTYEYYLSVHGRDSLDDKGMVMVSTAHYSRNYNNAFWNGEQMVYGDGDGTTFIELSGALDVVAHELTHGVTEYTSDLIYQDESGALNESFSDMMGTNCEFFADAEGLDPSVSPDWWIGEDVLQLAGAGQGIRNMADPEENGDPDHYTERQIGGGDNGGVHTNSGIPNHAYYLLVNGGLNASCSSSSDHDSEHCTGNETPVIGIDLAKAEQIFYLGFTGLNQNATMAMARAATEAVASGLFGPSSQERQATADAWSAVGVN